MLHIQLSAISYSSARQTRARSTERSTELTPKSLKCRFYKIKFQHSGGGLFSQQKSPRPPLRKGETDAASGIKHQASSIKQPASSSQHQATSIKHQAASIKHQAASIKHHTAGSLK
jgi:hypothetical protein